MFLRHILLKMIHKIIKRHVNYFFPSAAPKTHEEEDEDKETIVSKITSVLGPMRIKELFTFQSVLIQCRQKYFPPTLFEHRKINSAGLD